MSHSESTQGMLCIWCGKPGGPNEPVEHIVPEAIGCPEDFILTRGEVCGACNSGLADLDQALVADLEIYALMANVPRKRGKAPKVSSYGNFKAQVLDGHMTAYFNMENVAKTAPDGTVIPAFRGRERDIRAHFSVEGNQATVEYQMEFGRSPKVARALVKMAAEYVCWSQGAELAREVIAGPVADFVRDGRGSRPIIHVVADMSKYEHAFGTIGRVSDGSLFCLFHLAHFAFVIDLSPGLGAFRDIAAQMYASLGGTGWTTLPPDAFTPPTETHGGS